MTNLKRSFFWAAFYLAVAFIFAQTDYVGRPIVNFASYFYLTIMVSVPATLFFPGISKVSSYVPLGFWAGIYLVLLQIIDRSNSTDNLDFPVIVLEFLLLEIGVWISHQLAIQISNAESIMDALALGAFPSRVHSLEDEGLRIKVEFTRSRRYHRPLSVMALEADFGDDFSSGSPIRNIQVDLSHRFTSARIGQIIDDRIRQTDVLLRDHRGRFIILCPETDQTHIGQLADRISTNIKNRVNVNLIVGSASFPDEALTFDDLLQKAIERMDRSQKSDENAKIDKTVNEITKL